MYVLRERRPRTNEEAGHSELEGALGHEQQPTLGILPISGLIKRQADKHKHKCLGSTYSARMVT